MNPHDQMLANMPQKKTKKASTKKKAEAKE